MFHECFLIFASFQAHVSYRHVSCKKRQPKKHSTYIAYGNVCDIREEDIENTALIVIGYTMPL